MKTALKNLLGVELFLLAVLFVCFCVTGHAEVATPLPDPSVPFLDQALEFLKSLQGWEGFGALAVIIEFALRLIKTDKPMSILHMVRYALQKLADIFSVAAGLLDKVLPQRLK